MKLNYAIYSMLALSMVATSCSQDEELASNQPAAKSNITISVTDLGLTSGDGTRATTDASYATTFEDGDVVGLYAVSNGAIVESYKNVKLTKNGNSWTGLAAGSTFDKGTKFYAYYPYSESASFDVSTGFDTMVSSWDPTTKDSYDDGDLMTSAATDMNQTDGLTYSLSLELSHKMSMIEITANTGSSTTYKFQNTDVTLADYKVSASSSSSTTTIKIGDTDITTKADEVSGKYRVLVNPTTKSTLSIGIGDDTYKSDALSLTAGNYYTVTAGEAGEATEVPWTLAVGDYMCKDGTLLKSTDDNFATKKENIIGVVCYVGDPSPSQKYPKSYGSNASSDKDKTELDGIYKGGYSHGLVYSITGDKMTNAWGTTTCSTLYDSFAAVTTALAESSNSNISKRALLGHANMETIRAINSSNSSYFDNIIKAIDGFSVTAPSTTSGWFLPSQGDVKAIISGSVKDGNEVTVTFDGTTISNAFSAVNATLWETDVLYMTSSPGITSSKTNTEKFYGVKNSTISTYVVDGTQESVLRPFLAF